MCTGELEEERHEGAVGLPDGIDSEDAIARMNGIIFVFNEGTVNAYDHYSAREVRLGGPAVRAAAGLRANGQTVKY